MNPAVSNGEWKVRARLLLETWRDGFLYQIAYEFSRTTNGKAIWTVSIPLEDTKCLIECMNGQLHSWKLDADYYQTILSTELRKQLEYSVKGKRYKSAPPQIERLLDLAKEAEIRLPAINR